MLQAARVSVSRASVSRGMVGTPLRGRSWQRADRPVQPPQQRGGDDGKPRQQQEERRVAGLRPQRADRPASRLPLKMARNQDATVVAPSRGGASLANRPSPVGRMYSSPRVRMTKNATTHSQSTRASPASAVTVANSR